MKKSGQGLTRAPTGDPESYPSSNINRQSLAPIRTFIRIPSLYVQQPLQWFQYRTILEVEMPVSFSVKNVPDEVAARLRLRAKRHHRSIQGELLAILEETATSRRLTTEDAARKLRALSLRTPANSGRMLRQDRDAR